MVNKNILLMLIASGGGLFSCTSPTSSPPTQTPVNTPPVVVIAPNLSALQLGDSLKLTIHASDPTLLSGLIDFGDSTTTAIKHPRHILDTTVCHVFARLGIYSIKVTFDDGKLSTTDSLAIKVQHFYALTLKVGETWKFSYSYTSEGYGFNKATQYGMHEWRIISSAINIFTDTVYEVRETRQDAYQYMDPSNHSLDTAYAIYDSSDFSIIASSRSNTIQFHWPVLSRSMSGNSTYTVPNHAYLVEYPIRVHVGYGSDYSLYEDEVGPVNFHNDFIFTPQSTGYEIEDFSLMSWTYPWGSANLHVAHIEELAP